MSCSCFYGLQQPWNTPIHRLWQGQNCVSSYSSREIKQNGYHPSLDEFLIRMHVDTVVCCFQLKYERYTYTGNNILKNSIKVYDSMLVAILAKEKPCRLLLQLRNEENDCHAPYQTSFKLEC